MPHETVADGPPAAPERLADIFTRLEALPGDPRAVGTLEQRLPTQSPCDLFLGVQKPANRRSLRARFRADALPESYDLPAFRGLDLSQRRGLEDGSDRVTIILRAPEVAYGEVFAALAEDISRHVGAQTDENAAGAELRRRLLLWQRLLQKRGPEGLTAEEQRGLYGELWFFRHYLLPGPLAPAAAASAWTGPDGAPKDFQLPDGVAVEAKATLKREPQELEISSERQLDDTGFSALYLFHLSVEAARGAGETLPEAVTKTRQALTAAPEALALFDDHLMAAGYLAAHEPQYRDVGYVRHGEHLYGVKHGFPRILERDLPAGIGAVRYRVSVAACAPFAVGFDRMHVRQGNSA